MAHAVIWIIAIAGGTVFAKMVYPDLVKEGRVTLDQRIDQYRESWKEALARVGAHEPPPVEEVASLAPIGQQSGLQTKLDQIYKENLPKFLDKSRDHIAQLEKDFKAEWQECYDKFADTPTIAKFCDRVHPYHHEALKERFSKVDETLKRKQPRTRLALDSFSGYCVLRSEKFREKATARELKLHLMDDGAKYQERIKALKSGDVEMAVFTLDALINNSALFSSPPAAVVMVIDETRGADAMIAYKDAFKDVSAMNRPDTEIIMTQDSPSELLARLVRNNTKLPKLATECTFAAKDAEEVFKRFQEADPTEPKAFVMWEPFVSKALKNPNAHVLVDSSYYPGYIVDVLVARKDFLDANKEEVQAIVETYLETLAEVQRSPSGMVDLVREDSVRLAEFKKIPTPLTDEEAAKVVEGIWWKSAQENFGLFGLAPNPDPKNKPIDDMVKDIANVLTKAKVISKPVKSGQLYHKEICANLLVGAAKDDPWKRVIATTKLKADDLPFATGNAKISDLYQEDLEKLANKLAGKSPFYVEINANPRSLDDEDVKLAVERAEAVEKFLLTHGVVKEHIRIKQARPGPGTPKGNVSFVIKEDPSPPASP